MKTILSLIAAVPFLFASSVFAFGTGAEGCSGDCTACHKVTKQEAQDVFKKLDPSVTVEEISPAEVRGLYQLVLSRENGKGERGIAYLDFSKRFLIQGSVVELARREDVTQKKMMELLESQTVDVGKIPLENALVMGNPKGRKSLYVFSDPECPYCTKLHEELVKLVKTEPELKIYILLVPLDIHPNAGWKTNAIIQTAKKDMTKALAMLEASYGQKPVQKLTPGKDYGQDMKKLAETLGVGSTPTIVYANGKRGIGYKKSEEMKAALESNTVVRK